MIQSLSHIQRSRRLSQDFDDYLERTSRSSLHSSSSDISPHYDYAHQHEAKLQAYQQNQNRQIPTQIAAPLPPDPNLNYQHIDLMHNAHSGPNQVLIQPIPTTIQTKTTQQTNDNHPNPHNIIPSQLNHFQYPIGQNKLIGNLNAIKKVNLSQEHADFSDGFMDEMSSDSDLEDDEKIHNNPTIRMISGNNTPFKPKPSAKRIQYVQKNHHIQHPQLIHQLPKVPKPRNLNLNVHRQNNYKNNPVFQELKYLQQQQLKQVELENEAKEGQLSLARNYDRRDSHESAASSSINSSVCTPHRRDNDEHESHTFFEKQVPVTYSKYNMSGKSQLNLSAVSMAGAAMSQQSNMSNMSNNPGLGTMHSLQSTASINSLIGSGTIHINIKIFDPLEGNQENDVCTNEIWMNIKSNDTANDVIAAVIHQHQHGDKALAGSKVEDYELRYYDVDDDEIDDDFPPLGRNESVASKGIDAVAMRFIGDRNGIAAQRDATSIPDVDWEYCDYEVKDEYSVSKSKCILGIGRDRLHIVLKSNKTNAMMHKTHKSDGMSPECMQYPPLSHHSNPSATPPRRASMTGSLMPHFTYVFNLPADRHKKVKNLHQHRWIDARILTRQKNCRIKLHQNEQQKSYALYQMNEAREQINATNRSIATTFNNYHNLNLKQSVPKLGLLLQTSVPTDNLLQNMQQLRLTPLRSGLLLDEYENVTVGVRRKQIKNVPVPRDDDAKSAADSGNKHKRRQSSAWSFNLFGLLNKKSKQKELPFVKGKVAEVPKIALDKKASTSTVCTDEGDVINYEQWNTYNKDGKYFDKTDLTSPDIGGHGHYRSASGSISSFRSGRNSCRRRSSRSSVASILSQISIENDEFTPLTIELCQKIAVLKRDNTVFEINFLLDLSSKTCTPSIYNVSMNNLLISKEDTPKSISVELTNSVSMSLPDEYEEKEKAPFSKINHNRTASKQYWGPRSKRKVSLNGYRRESNESDRQIPPFGKQSTISQSSTRSLSIQSGGGTFNVKENRKHFQPYQADNIEIWSQSHSERHSKSPSESPSRSSSMELIDAGDYKPSNYTQHWNPRQIIPKLEQISAAQKQQQDEKRCDSKVEKQCNHIISHPNSLVKQLVNKTKFLVFGNDKYLTHTVRYTAKSPEDCCQIVRKIQHLMLLENKAMDENSKK